MREPDPALAKEQASRYCLAAAAVQMMCFGRRADGVRTKYAVVLKLC